MASRSNRPDFNRRKLLGLIGMGGAVGIAGCIGDDDDAEDTPTPTPDPDDTPTPTPTPTPPPEDAQQQIYTVQTEDETLTVESAADAVADGVYGMKFTFHLREGIEFHDGSELTADDVIASYKRYEFSMVDDQTFDDIIYYEKEDDYTVNVYLAYADPEGIRNSTVTIMQEDQALLDDGALDPREGNVPVGTGPYEFDEFEDGSFYVVQKNDNYWLDDHGLDVLDTEVPDDFPSSPVFDEIDMDLIPSDPTRQAALQNDEVDVTYGLDAEVLTPFDEDDDFKVRTTQAGGYDFLQFPIQVEPWDSEELRNGVNHLIPRETIAQQIFDGWRDEAWMPLPELAYEGGTQDPVALEELCRPRNEYKPDEGVEMIENVIDERDLETPIEITVETNADNDDRVSTNQLIVESMNASGLFDASLELYEWGAFLDRILSPDYYPRGHMMYVGLSGTFDPASFCEANHHSRAVGGCCNSNYTSWDDLDEKMDAASRIVGDQDAREAAYDEIWDIITERHGTVYTVIGTNAAVMWDKVNGFEPYPFSEGMFSYALHSPYGEVATWIDEDQDDDEDWGDITEGGTLRIGVAENINSFDPPYSLDTTSSLGQSFLFEGLTTATAEGAVEPWLAESWDLEVNEDIGLEDYEPYMITYEEAGLA